MRDPLKDIDPTAPLAEQASSWWLLLNEGNASPADQRAFGDWVARSPERVAAYLRVAQLHQALGSPQIHWPQTSVDDLIRAARAAPSEVATLPVTTSVPHPDADRRGSARRVPGWISARRVAALAACLIAAAAIGIGLYVDLEPLRIETALGEQRSVVLGDGSLVTLNTSSSIEVRLTKSRRSVVLLSGEALFDVAHEATRPFDVTAGDSTVRAVGTQFNVDRRAVSTTVTVVEGRVAVFTPTSQSTPGTTQTTRLPLEAGEQLTLAPRASRSPVRMDVTNAIAWTQRRLVFEHRQLGEVAAEFNRYNRQVIEIRSAGLRTQEVTGVFQANDPHSFVAFLARIPGVSIETSDDSSRIVVTQATLDTSQ